MMGELRSSSLQSCLFYTRARNYGSCLGASLFSDEIDEKVYGNLIDCVNEGLPILHRYMALKKKLLNLDRLEMYDINAPLFDEPSMKFSFDESINLVTKALAPMGQDYVSTMKHILSDRAIDVFPAENKRSGAYSWGNYDSHPYVLLNHVDKLDDVFTVAHELGHSMHSLYSKTQPYAYHQYTTFCAEIASTTNEQLLFHSMMNEVEDSVKPYLLDMDFGRIKSTLFRQTQFSEFEKVTHEMAENGEPINSEVLCRLYANINAKYYGKDVNTDEMISMEWARIPHFYSDFYVYTYSTGIISAFAISKSILDEGESAAKNYTENFLRAGSSRPSLDILKSAGVDLTTKEPFRKALGVAENLVKELEKSV
jgi:oligoendopeptidase F